MRQLIPFAITVFSISAALIAGYLYFWYIPSTIEKQVTHSFERVGFKNFTFANKTHGGGKLVFQDVALDEDNFSKIESITVRYSIFAFLTNGRRADSLTIRQLRLTGDFDADGTPNISGWDKRKSIMSILAMIPAQTVMLEENTLDLLSETFGGISFKFDIQIRNEIGKPAQIRGRIKSIQKKFGFDARVDGLISALGAIDLKADIEQIQMQTDDYEIRRFNAKMLLKKDPETPGNISLEGVAGSVLWHGMPLGEVNLTYESSADNYNIFAEGQTIGLQAIEFSSQINNVNGITHYETTIAPTNVKDLVAYLEANKIVSGAETLPPYLMSIQQPILTVETKFSAQSPDTMGNLKLISDQPSFEIGGSFKVSHGENKITGSFAMPDTTTAIQFSPEQKEAENENAVIAENTPHASPVTIDISAKGAFEISDWGTPQSALRWAYEILPKNGEITYGQLKLRDIGGKISNNNATKNANSDTSLNYVLPLKSMIAHKGTISLNMNDPAAPFIKQILLQIYGGTIRSNALSFKDGNLPQNISLKIEDINLSPLLKDTRIGGLNMVGQMGGVLPLILADNKIIVKGGILQSEGPGIARISPYVSTGIFPGYTLEMQRIRDALENYYYEFFEIRFDGDLSSSTMMTLSARGYNPDLADKTPVDLNLQIETPTSTFLSNLVKQ